jgi:hypothetical protein
MFGHTTRRIEAVASDLLNNFPIERGQSDPHRRPSEILFQHLDRMCDIKHELNAFRSFLVPHPVFAIRTDPHTFL